MSLPADADLLLSYPTDDPSRRPQMANPGKLVIGVMLLVAVSLASFGIWYNRTKTLRSLRFYGTAGVAQVLNAEQVELLKLSTDTAGGNAAEVGAAESSADSESIRVPGFNQTAVVTQRKAGAEARGLLHVRQALLVDGSYDWQATDSGCVPSWDYGLRFGPLEEQTTLLFSMNCSLLVVVESGKSVSMEPISKGLKKYLQEQFADPE